MRSQTVRAYQNKIANYTRVVKVGKSVAKTYRVREHSRHNDENTTTKNIKQIITKGILSCWVSEIQMTQEYVLLA